MMLRTYDYRCSTCNKIETKLVEQESRDEAQTCEKCGYSYMTRTFSKPIIRTAKLSASFIDGQRMKSKEFQDMRVQQELEDQVHEAPDFAEGLSAQIELEKFKGNIS
jgi:putative FmdB family regulatory protein